MTISVHLMFGGQCEAAFAAYARILGGTVEYSLRYGDSPVAAGTPPEWHDKLYHATMTVGDLKLLGGDVLPAEYRPLQGVMLVLDPADPDEAHQVFRELADGGVVQMPIQETFWSAAFGVVTDRFGVTWEINCEQSPQSA